MAGGDNLLTIVQTVALFLGALTGVAVLGSVIFWAGRLQEGQKNIKADLESRRSTTDSKFEKVEKKIDKVEGKIDDVKNTIIRLHTAPQGGSSDDILNPNP